ncbi:MAG: FAD binding domain-containing protein [Pseudomonadota bacterium]
MPLTVETYASAAEAQRALGPEARYHGGGTLVMRDVNAGDTRFRRLVRTTDPTLSRIAPQGGRLEIGAGVTMAEIIDSRECRFLAAAARAVGGPAVREQATVGGNLFAEHPYGDFTAALLALDATVTTADGRERPLPDLLTERARAGASTTARLLVTKVSVARPAEGTFRFAKVSRVKPKGISVLSIAAWLPLSGGRVSGARVAFGAMGPTPLRHPAVERALEGRALDPTGIAPALAAVSDGLSPQDDAIATAWYRRQVAPVHLRRLLLGEP